MSFGQSAFRGRNMLTSPSLAAGPPKAVTSLRASPPTSRPTSTAPAVPRLRSTHPPHPSSSPTPRKYQPLSFPRSHVVDSHSSYGQRDQNCIRWPDWRGSCRAGLGLGLRHGPRRVVPARAPFRVWPDPRNVPVAGNPELELPSANTMERSRHRCHR